MDPIEEKERLINCLTQQISEYELLKAIYPNQSEIMLTDRHTVDEINKFLSNQSEYVPNHLDFKVNLHINGYKVQVFVNLPSCYPDEEPDLHVSCNWLNRQCESKLNSALCSYLKDNHTGEVCLYTGISWLQENIESFANMQEPLLADNVPEVQGDVDTPVRLWVYSHHIYNKKKRDEIVRKSREFKLTGFCVPGKPGIICIEGFNRDCNEWWKDIKAMNWKKIMIRKTETFKHSEQNNYKKFSNFEELSLKNPTNNKHSNMSELSKYMNERGLTQVFNELFRLCTED